MTPTYCNGTPESSLKFTSHNDAHSLECRLSIPERALLMSLQRLKPLQKVPEHREGNRSHPFSKASTVLLKFWIRFDNRPFNFANPLECTVGIRITKALFKRGSAFASEQ
ncbi:hypothetical protein CEXT_398421 [Caerostris extrusa]|uniref:Uncharacterized protein n=1 Tax=Caerostris extrusa TaxID=172846 RepID=A0AAV4RMH1_CAEEX|nr:hypothetical protein CEXT_398421 [Caerostris extrusa]